MLMVSTCLQLLGSPTRVIKSTLAAEMLALVDAAEAWFWLQSVANKVLGTSDYNIDCFVHSQSLFDAVYSMTSLLNKRQRVDVVIIREMIQKNEIGKATWVTTKSQLADCLIEKGCCAASLLQVLITNQLYADKEHL